LRAFRVHGSCCAGATESVKSATNDLQGHVKVAVEGLVRRKVARTETVAALVPRARHRNPDCTSCKSRAGTPMPASAVPPGKRCCAAAHRSARSVGGTWCWHDTAVPVRRACSR
jgi:hypothetical protein